MLKFIAYLVCYIIYPFSFLVPRDKKLLAFGSYRGAFNDNTKYLFLYANEHCKGYRSVWLSTAKQTALHVRTLGYEAYYIGSLKGAWLALRSGYWFVNSYTSDIVFCLSGGAKIVDLWHGVPMKCIEFGITKGELAKRYVERRFWDVFYHPAPFIRPDYIVSMTNALEEVFSKSFRVGPERCLKVGYPRNRMLTLPKEEVNAFVERYESSKVRELIEHISHFDKVYVYMPTWRDSQLNCFANGFDLDAFNETLKSRNAYALMKPHSNTVIDNSKSYSNLQFIGGNVDMYCILPYTDVLITDYSSVMYDYMLMQGKKILLFHYDYEEYVRDREFVFPVDKNFVGYRIYSFQQLLDSVADDSWTMDEAEFSRIKERSWGHTMDPDQDVCMNILQQVLH